MTVTPEQLRQHYVSLSDESLLAIDPNELTDIAQKCYKSEIERRGLSPAPVESPDDVTATPQQEYVEPDAEVDGDEPFIACSFTDVPNGRAYAADAEDACRVLKAARIPCRIEVQPVAPETVDDRLVERQVIVPSGYTLHATSVLDRDFFNPRIESDWKTHLASLSDEQFQRLNLDDICAGLLDRAARLKRAYFEERRKRGFQDGERAQSQSG